MPLNSGFQDLPDDPVPEVTRDQLESRKIGSIYASVVFWTIAGLLLVSVLSEHRLGYLIGAIIFWLITVGIAEYRRRLTDRLDLMDANDLDQRLADGTD